MRSSSAATTVGASRGAAVSRAAIGLLSAAGSVSVAAFVLAPAALLSGTHGDLGDEAALRDAVGRGLVEYWRDGRPQFPAPLARLVDYWFRWHAIKVGISALMLVVFALLAIALWRRYLHGTTRYSVGAIGATVFTVVATGLLMLNVQATAVPLIALLPLSDGGDLGRAQQEIREALAGPDGAHAGSPALTVLLGEAERYHWVMVATAATVIVVIGLVGAALWRRRAVAGSRVGFMRRTLGAVLAVTASLLLFVGAASAYSATEPATTLLAALNLH